MKTLELATLPLKFLSEFKMHPAAFRYNVLSDEKLDEKLLLPLQNLKKMLQKFKDMQKSPSSLREQDLEDLQLNSKEKIDNVINKLRKPAQSIINTLKEFVINAVNSELPPLGSYIAIVLSEEDSELLKNAFKGIIGSNWNLFCHHCTLMHSNDFHKQPTQWKQLMELLGEAVELNPVGYLKDDKVVALAVNLQTKTKNVDIEKFVASGVPHITIATAASIEPYQSVASLKSNKNPLLSVPANVSSITATIELVTFH